MTTVLVIAAIVTVISFKLIGAMMRFFDRNIGALLVLRFVIGHHHGRTDATFWHSASKITHPSGRASKFQHRAGWQRLLIRLATIAVLGAILYGWYTARTDTETAVILAGVLLTLWGTYRGYRAAMLATFRRSTLDPLCIAVGDALNMSAQAASDSVSLRPDYATVRDSGAYLGMIVLPDNWRPDQETAMTALLHSRLGSDIDLHFRTGRAPFTVEITRTPQPPKTANLSAYLPDIRMLRDDQVLLAVNGRNENTVYDMANEDPHFLCVAPSRRGKTRLLLLIASQVLAQGGEVTIIDPKRVGIGPILGSHPRVHLYSDPRNVEVMWKAIRDYRLMVEDRIDAVEANPALTFKRHMLIVDEISMFSSLSKDHWQQIKERGDSATPPVWDDFKSVTYMGAQFRANIAVFGQEADLRIIPGLNQYGMRLITGYTKRAWDRLVGTTPVPVSPKARGRFYSAALGSDPTLIQTILGDDETLRELAFSDSKPADKPADKIIQGTVIKNAA